MTRFSTTNATDSPPVGVQRAMLSVGMPLRTVCLEGVVTTVAAFLRHVTEIVGGSSEEQVVYVDARRCVTSMAEVKANSQFTPGDKPCGPVGLHRAPADWKGVCAVAMPVISGSPQNAPRIGFRDGLFPEPFSPCLRYCHVLKSSTLLFVRKHFRGGSTLGALTGAWGRGGSTLGFGIGSGYGW